jgi:hypothetical protein
MGKDNRQRRAAKQKKRAAEQRGRSTGGDDRDVSLEEILWSAVEVVAEGSGDDAAHVIEVLDSFPADLDVVIQRAVQQAVATATAHGWCDDDLRELRDRRVKQRVDASQREVSVRWLAMLSALPPLPPVAPRRTQSGHDQALLGKIRALLAKAESTTFPEEAEALTTKAQELMARHRIEAVLLGGDEESDPVGRRIWLDDPYADAKSQLLAQVAAANGCRSIVLTGLGCAHVTGFATDLDVVELLHTSLLVQATSAMAAAGPQRDHRGRSRTRSFRQTFLVAYAWRIGERLRVTSDAIADEVASRESDLLPAIVRREQRVEDAVARAFPQAERRSISFSNAQGWRAGTIAADSADLSVGPRLTSR